MAMLNDQRVKSRNQVDQHKKYGNEKKARLIHSGKSKTKRQSKKRQRLLKKGKKTMKHKMRPQKKKNTREMPKGKTKCGQKGYDKGATILHPLVDCDVSQLTYLNIMLDANFCSLESHFPKTLLFPSCKWTEWWLCWVMLGCTPDLKGFLGFDSTTPPLLGQNLWFSIAWWTSKGRALADYLKTHSEWW